MASQQIYVYGDKLPDESLAAELEKFGYAIDLPIKTKRRGILRKQLNHCNARAKAAGGQQDKLNIMRNEPSNYKALAIQQEQNTVLWDELEPTQYRALAAQQEDNRVLWEELGQYSAVAGQQEDTRTQANKHEHIGFVRSLFGHIAGYTKQKDS